MKVIKKKLSFTPNLANYDKTYKSFDWKDYKNEISYFRKNKLNAAFNAVDRHATTEKKNKIAMYYEGPEGEREKYTFAEVAQMSNKIANYLRHKKIDRGDRVFIFLPRVPMLYFSFLGILKVGAIAGSLFSAFQEQALLDRLENSGAKIVITNKELGERVKKVRRHLPKLEEVIYVDDYEFQEKLAKMPADSHIAEMDPEDPAFMLYTSGTTGKPKGVVHVHGGITQQHLSAKWVLDLKEDDVYWCTADPGWVTGIVYEILGVWSNGTAQVIFSGRFEPEIWYRILEEYKVTVWYTAPTAVRMLMAAGTKSVHKFDLSSLRHMCSVGEPLNPEAVEWGVKAFGLVFHDTWWQTEIGAMAVVNFPSLDVKPGSMGKPFPGMVATILDKKGKECPVGVEGDLALKPGWPSMMKTIWRRPVKYKSYFEHGWYISGDRAYKDKDGYFWFMARADDVIKTSGERVGPFEVESALVSHPSVVEAGVIGKPDQLRGEIIKAFVVLKKGVKPTDNLKMELAMHVKKHLAGHAYPREVEFIDKLPKTRSGKIMRRILKAKELGLPIGDTSTLEDY